MIQSILIFALGFLCAGLLALMIAPAIWRRAVRLTKKRVEASAPLTIAEIQADKDRMRAEHAMALRRVEISAKTFREKAAAQIIEINRNREELKALSEQRRDKSRAVAELEEKVEKLERELRGKEERLRKLTERLESAQKALEKRAAEVERLEGLYEDASYASSTRQIELVARESDLDRLQEEVRGLREALTLTEERAEQAAAENARLADELAADSRRVADLEAGIERRERELAGEQGDNIEKAMAGLAADRELLEQRLTVLTRENRKLKDEIEALRQPGQSSVDGDSAVLREQMSHLAAQVVNLTAMIEGSDSPIARALAATSGPDRPVNDAGEKVASLADRVRALQKAASGG